jgi:hypothetical protein
VSKPIPVPTITSLGLEGEKSDLVEHLQTNKATVTLGVLAGGKLAAEATHPQYRPLRRLLQAHCQGPYSAEVDEFSLILRIDGDIDHWEKEGCDRMRRSKKERYITIDIYVPRQRWEGVEGIQIRRYLATCVQEAFEKMIGKLQRDKVAIDGYLLLRDFAIVKEQYLTQPDPPAGL